MGNNVALARFFMFGDSGQGLSKMLIRKAFVMNKINLYAVAVGGVYPTQCVTVYESRDKAQAVANYLNQTIRNVCTVQTVDSFWPSHMCQADLAWLRALDSMPGHVLEN